MTPLGRVDLGHPHEPWQLWSHTYRMAMKFSCPECNQRLSVSPQKSGDRVKCPKCKQVIVAVQTPSSEDEQHEDAAPVEAPPRQGAEQENPFAKFAVFDRPELVYETPTEEQPDPTAVDGSRLAVPRSVVYMQGALLGAVAIAFFVFGMIVGSQNSRRETAQGKPTPCVITGQIAYRGSGNETFPDEGTVVLLVPESARPEEKTPVDGLRPEDPIPSQEHDALRTIRVLGGAYARTNEQGRFRLRVPDGGKYFILIVSRHKRRGSDEPANRRDLAQIGRYFLPATDLLGRQKYQWEEISLRRDREMNVVF